MHMISLRKFLSMMIIALIAVVSSCSAFITHLSLNRGLIYRGSGTISMSTGKALIVQNKGGGHGELGYHLANILVDKGISVTILQDSGAKKEKEPFKSYSNLESKGVEVIWGDLKDGSALLSTENTYDYVFDNFAKDVDTAISIAEASKKWDVKHYVYVSSAGMYKNTEELPLLETDAVKETGQRKVELMAEEMGLPWTSFRPQYIYGPLMNKRDYLDWFFDRVTWGMDPLPLPHHGDQFVALTHAEDVASMLAAVIGNSNAIGQIFNCASTRCITYNALVKAVATVCGQDPSEIKHRYYDPEDYDAQKGYFPFRENHFFVSSDKAVRLLKWNPKHDLMEDLKWYKESYIKAGKADAPPPNFQKDDEINIIDPDYIPWMLRWELHEEHPNLEEELEEIHDTMVPLNRLYYSGMLEQLKDEYKQQSESS